VGAVSVSVGVLFGGWVLNHEGTKDTKSTKSTKKRVVGDMYMREWGIVGPVSRASPASNRPLSWRGSGNIRSFVPFVSFVPLWSKQPYISPTREVLP